MKPVFNQEKKFMQFTDGNFVLTVYKGRWKVFMIRPNRKNINKKEYYEHNLVIKAKNPALAGLGFSQIVSAFIRLGGDVISQHNKEDFEMQVKICKQGDIVFKTPFKIMRTSSTFLQESFMQEISWEDVSTPHKQTSYVSFDLKNNRPKPTGRRKITRAEQVWNQKLTGKFKTTSRTEVLLTFKKASPELGINDAVCRLIDLLCCWTKPVDWQENGWPLVWPSNDTLCEHLGFDERKLQRIRTRAIDTGLIRMCETRDNKRWGRRRNNDPEAVIVEGCGYDLSPLAERREEFLALIQQAEERRKQKGYLRRACSHWKRKILGHADYALQQGYNERKWLSLAQEAQSLSRKVFRLQTIEPIFELELALQRLYKKVKIEITKDEKETNNHSPSPSLLNSVNMSPTGDKFNGLYTTTNNKIISKANTNEILTDMAQEEKKDLLRKKILLHKIKPNTLKTPDLFNGFTVTPHFILKIAPTFKEWITSKIINWNTVENALPYALQHLKINPYIWKQACKFFGLQQAITIIAIIEAKYTLKSVRNPGGLLRAFITLYQQGKLHLDKTLFGLIHTLSIV